MTTKQKLHDKLIRILYGRIFQLSKPSQMSPDTFCKLWRTVEEQMWIVEKMQSNRIMHITKKQKM